MLISMALYVSDAPTAVLPPVQVSSAIPVVVGTASVDQVEGGGPVNEPVLCYTYKEAVETFGWSDDWKKYTLCDFIYSFFALFNVAPVVLINIFDPTSTTNIDAVSSADIIGGINAGTGAVTG